MQNKKLAASPAENYKWKSEGIKWSTAKAMNLQ